jgi:hypothetical protein
MGEREPSPSANEVCVPQGFISNGAQEHSRGHPFTTPDSFEHSLENGRRDHNAISGPSGTMPVGLTRKW